MFVRRKNDTQTKIHVDILSSQNRTNESKRLCEWKIYSECLSQNDNTKFRIRRLIAGRFVKQNVEKIN